MRHLLLPLLVCFQLVALGIHAEEAPRYAVESGTYRAHVPAGWNGTTPLAVLVFFHGFGQSGGLVMRNDALMTLADERQVLVVAPDGQELTTASGTRSRWNHQGAPMREQLRDDEGFTASILADIRRRWPVDDTRVWASGFSIGGSMTWHLACYRGDLFTAFMPVAGAFWRPHPDACPSGPVNLLHVHGTGDTVVPMTGRPIAGGAYHQGDVLAGIAFWRAQDNCRAEPSEVVEVGDLRCEIWRGCGSGRVVQLCLHPGGHMVPKDYMARALDWAEGLATGG